MDIFLSHIYATLSLDGIGRTSDSSLYVFFYIPGNNRKCSQSESLPYIGHAPAALIVLSTVCSMWVGTKHGVGHGAGHGLPVVNELKKNKKKIDKD